MGKFQVLYRIQILDCYLFLVNTGHSLKSGQICSIMIDISSEYHIVWYIYINIPVRWVAWTTNHLFIPNAGSLFTESVIKLFYLQYGPYLGGNILNINENIFWLKNLHKMANGTSFTNIFKIHFNGCLIKNWLPMLLYGRDKGSLYSRIFSCVWYSNHVHQKIMTLNKRLKFLL